jgi:hypothetical protein
MVALYPIHLLKEDRQDKVCLTIVTGQHRKQIDDTQFYNASIVNRNEHNSQCPNALERPTQKALLQWLGVQRRRSPRR